MRVPFADQALNAVGQHGSFARSSASHDQHRAVDMLNRFALTIVWGKGSGTRIRLRRPHLMVRISSGGRTRRPREAGAITRSSAETVIAVAAMAEVSARRIVPTKRGGDPAFFVEKLEFVLSPSAFGTNREKDFTVTVRLGENIAEHRLIFRFG